MENENNKMIKIDMTQIKDFLYSNPSTISKNEGLNPKINPIQNNQTLINSNKFRNKKKLIPEQSLDFFSCTDMRVGLTEWTHSAFSIKNTMDLLSNLNRWDANLLKFWQQYQTDQTVSIEDQAMFNLWKHHLKITLQYMVLLHATLKDIYRNYPYNEILMIAGTVESIISRLIEAPAVREIGTDLGTIYDALEDLQPVIAQAIGNAKKEAFQSSNKISKQQESSGNTQTDRILRRMLGSTLIKQEIEGECLEFTFKTPIENHSQLTLIFSKLKTIYNNILEKMDASQSMYNTMESMIAGFSSKHSEPRLRKPKIFLKMCFKQLIYRGDNQISRKIDCIPLHFGEEKSIRNRLQEIMKTKRESSMSVLDSKTESAMASFDKSLGEEKNNTSSISAEVNNYLQITQDNERGVGANINGEIKTGKTLSNLVSAKAGFDIDVENKYTESKTKEIENNINTELETSLNIIQNSTIKNSEDVKAIRESQICESMDQIYESINEFDSSQKYQNPNRFSTIYLNIHTQLQIFNLYIILHDFKIVFANGCEVREFNIDELYTLCHLYFNQPDTMYDRLSAVLELLGSRKDYKGRKIQLIQQGSVSNKSYQDLIPINQWQDDDTTIEYQGQGVVLRMYNVAIPDPFPVEVEHLADPVIDEIERKYVDLEIAQKDLQNKQIAMSLYVTDTIIQEIKNIQDPKDKVEAFWKVVKENKEMLDQVYLNRFIMDKGGKR